MRVEAAANYRSQIIEAIGFCIPIALAIHRLHKVEQYFLGQFFRLLPAEPPCGCVELFLDRYRLELHIERARIAAR